MFSRILVVALFEITGTLIQPKSPSMNECIKQIQHIHSHYETITKNETQLLTTKWRKYERILCVK